MDEFKHWIETYPLAVPIITVALLAAVGLVGVVLKTFGKIKANSFYESADMLSLDVLDASSGGTGVPYLIGMYKGRNLEVTGYQKPTTHGILFTIVRIKMVHHINLNRLLEFEYNAVKKPPLQRFTIDGKEHPFDSLLSLRYFNEDTVDDLETFLATFTMGTTIENSILVFSINEVTFDRELSLTGSSEKLVNGVEYLHQILTRMEELTGYSVRK